MINEKPQLTRKHLIFLVSGLLVYVIFLYVFFDFGAIILAIQHAYLPYYCLAFIATVMNMFFHSLTWWLLLNSLSIMVPFKRIFSFIWIGNFVDILVPAESVSGEITRGYLMSRYLGENAGKVTASIVSQRIIYTTTSLVCLIIGSIIFTIKQEMMQPILVLIILIMIGAGASLIFLCILCLKRKLARNVINSLLDLFNFILKRWWHLDHLKSKVQETLDVFYEGLRTLGKQSLSLIWPIAFSTLAWLSKMLITFLVFMSLSIKIPLSAIVVVFSLIDTIQTIPLGIPGEVGVIEVVMTGLYTALGINPVISATATILNRVVTMWFNLSVGGLIVQWYGVKTFRETRPDQKNNNH